MPVTVQICVNGKTVDNLRIVNRTPCAHTTPDRQNTTTFFCDCIARYDVYDRHGRVVQVEHQRCDPLRVLVGKALNELVDTQRLQENP